MIVRSTIGTSVTGAGRYVLGEGKGAGNDNLPAGAKSRVAWIGGQNLGFVVSSQGDARLALKIMEFDAINQSSRTQPCTKDAVHLVLAWRIGEAVTREGMEAAAAGALTAIGMGNAKAIWTAHTDELHPHLHIVASKINPDTGHAYDLKGDHIKLAEWALAYERAHGGIICIRRQEADVLRQAIKAGDTEAVLKAVTVQRSTFSTDDLDRVLGKYLESEVTRERIIAAIIARPEIVHLRDPKDAAAERYTTEAVLKVENRALDAIQNLRDAKHHDLGQAGREAVRGGVVFAYLNPEQRAALDHAIDQRGIALIDGQAGTGKSYTLAAIRQAYEADGHRVIGLAPTNAVAGDMQRDGFFRAATINSELFALHNGRQKWDAKTVVIVDEAAMVSSGLLMQLAEFARDRGAKLILAGDDRQLASIDRGGLFGALKDRHGAATLSEVARQYKQSERRAASMMAEGNFHGALSIFEANGAISWSKTPGEAYESLVTSWTHGTATRPDKSRFVFAYTNVDVLEVNASLRQVRRGRGELGEDVYLTTVDGTMPFATGDRIQMLRSDKSKGLYNATIGTITAIDGAMIDVIMDGRASPVRIDSERFRDFRYGYAGTVYKGQGRTLDETYLYHSPHWKAAASYVGLTRHREQTEIFVDRKTAPNIHALARQMSRTEERRAAVQFTLATPANDSGTAPPQAAIGTGRISTPAEIAELEELLAAADRAQEYDAAWELENEQDQEHDQGYG